LILAESVVTGSHEKLLKARRSFGRGQQMKIVDVGRASNPASLGLLASEFINVKELGSISEEFSESHVGNCRGKEGVVKG
jgi:hypothetical protein